MTCLIIAAGKGIRLHQRGESKPLIPILGIPMIERIIRTAMEVGVDEFYVVTGYQCDHVCDFLERLAERLAIRITPLVNEDWERENGLSVLKARDVLHESFLLLMADHLFEPSLARALTTLTMANKEIALMVDGETRNPLVDMEDVTRVRVEDGKIRDIGKGLSDFNGFDTGVFLCSPAIFEAIEQSKEKNGDSTLSGAVRVLAGKGLAKAIPVSGFWIDVDDPGAFRRAEKALLDRLRDKSNDGPISRYLNRPISVQFSRQLVKFDITPNQISLFSMFTTGRRTVCAGRVYRPAPGRCSGAVCVHHRRLRRRSGQAQVPKQRLRRLVRCGAGPLCRRFPIVRLDLAPAGCGSERLGPVHWFHGHYRLVHAELHSGQARQPDA